MTGIVYDCRAGACPDECGDGAVGFAGGEHVARAGDVDGVDERFEAPAEAFVEGRDEAGCVDYGGWVGGLESGGYGGGIGDVAVDEGGFLVGWNWRGEVEYRDGPVGVVFLQRFDDESADEAGAAGDQDGGCHC